MNAEIGENINIINICMQRTFCGKIAYEIRNELQIIG